MFSSTWNLFLLFWKVYAFILVFIFFSWVSKIMISPSKKVLLTKIYVFFATYCSYASFHVCRTLWSYSKDAIKKDPVYGYSSEFFGLCDFIFLIVYAFSFYGFSWVGDRIDLRIFLSIGSIGNHISIKINVFVFHPFSHKFTNAFFISIANQ